LKGASAKGHFYESLSMLPNLEDEFHRQIGVVADIEAAKSPAQSQTSNSKKGMDTKNGIIGVGDRVYCRWPNDFWYWGEVTKKFKKGKMYLYSVSTGRYLDLIILISVAACPHIFLFLPS
jgi:hypothetical protein